MPHERSDPTLSGSFRKAKRNIAKRCIDKVNSDLFALQIHREAMFREENSTKSGRLSGFASKTRTDVLTMSMNIEFIFICFANTSQSDVSRSEPGKAGIPF